MEANDTVTGEAEAASSALLTVDVENITQTRLISASFQSDLSAGAAAAALAVRMSVPANVPCALRDDRAAFLEDARPLGEQVTPGEKLTLTPRSHLG